MCDELLLGEDEGECSLLTSPLKFKNMFLFEGQLEAMCPKPKHLKHLKVGLSCVVLVELGLGVGSWEDLEGVLKSFFSLPFQG